MQQLHANIFPVPVSLIEFKHCNIWSCVPRLLAPVNSDEYTVIVCKHQAVMKVKSKKLLNEVKAVAANKINAFIKMNGNV